MKRFKTEILILLIVFLVSGISLLRAKEINGIVYEDRNQNLKLDAGEPGIEGVLVSNQTEVVQTNRNGQYTINVTEETVIFVIKPAGYAVPSDKNKLPQFYYIHQPKGSPNFKYAGVSPTGNPPKSLNFPLFKTQPSDTFEAIIFSDPQARDEMEISYIRDDIAAELVGTNAKFGITLGDIMFDDLRLYNNYNQIIGQIGIPFYNVPGNHDMNYDSSDDHYALETYKAHYGPPYYAFEYGRVNFIVLDDVEYLGRSEEGRVQYQGKIGDEQLRWIENYLKYVPTNHLIVLSMHIPLYTSYGNYPGNNVADRATLFNILKEFQNVVALAGHMHTLEHQFLETAQNWRGENPLHQLICAAVSGAWWRGPKDVRGIPVATQKDGTPNGYHIFRFEGTNYSERYQAAFQPRNFQMRILRPASSMARDSLLNKKIMVNVFDGSEKSKVEYRIDDQNWHRLDRTIQKDPWFVQLYSEHKEKYDYWIEPDNSMHIWTGEFPDNISSGIHTIQIRTTDQFGQSYTQVKIFEIQ